MRFNSVVVRRSVHRPEEHARCVPRAAQFAIAAGAMLGVLATAPGAWAAIAVPNDRDSTAGDNRSVSILNTTNAHYQAMIASSQLTGINVGDQITGLSLRLAVTPVQRVTWPPSNVSWSNLTVQMSQSGLTPATMSATLSDNVLNPVTVFNSSLSILANSFPGGATAPTPNPFYQLVTFTTPYTYQGGVLVFDLIHPSYTNPGASSDLDGINQTSTAAGYGTLFNSKYVSSTTATTGAVINFAIVQFQVTAAPSPSALPLLGLAGLAATRRRRP